MLLQRSQHHKHLQRDLSLWNRFFWSHMNLCFWDHIFTRGGCTDDKGQRDVTKRHCQQACVQLFLLRCTNHIINFPVFLCGALTSLAKRRSCHHLNSYGHRWPEERSKPDTRASGRLPGWQRCPLGDGKERSEPLAKVRLSRYQSWHDGANGKSLVYTSYSCTAWCAIKRRALSFILRLGLGFVSFLAF